MDEAVELALRGRSHPALRRLDRVVAHASRNGSQDDLVTLEAALSASLDRHGAGMEAWRARRTGVLMRRPLTQAWRTMQLEELVTSTPRGQSSAPASAHRGVPALFATRRLPPSPRVKGAERASTMSGE